MDEEKAHGQHRRTDQTAHDSPTESASDGAGTAPEIVAINITHRGTLANYPACYLPGGINYVTKEQLDALIQQSLAYQAQINAMTVYPLLSQFDEAIMHRLMEPLPNAGITVGEIIGWRFWFVSDEGLLLSTFSPAIWFPREPMTVNHISSTATVEDRGGAGVYAFKTREDAEKESSIYRFTKPSQICVIGSVRLWGDVIEHETGWRAQFAMIEKFVAVAKGDRSDKRLLLDLAKRYTPDVVYECGELRRSKARIKNPLRRKVILAVVGSVLAAVGIPLSLWRIFAPAKLPITISLVYIAVTVIYGIAALIEIGLIRFPKRRAQ